MSTGVNIYLHVKLKYNIIRIDNIIGGVYMNIDTANLKTEVGKLDSLIDKYEEVYLNMYNEFNSTSFYWVDNYARKFFSDMNISKAKLRNTIDEIKSYRDIYRYIISSYERFGRIVKYELRYRSEIESAIKNYMSKLETIIRMYSNLDLSYCPEVRDRLNAERTRFPSI